MGTPPRRTRIEADAKRFEELKVDLARIEYFSKGTLQSRMIKCGKPKCPDRKSTRLNSSHLVISYAVFCLKKKKNTHMQQRHRDHRVTQRVARRRAPRVGSPSA